MGAEKDTSSFSSLGTIKETSPEFSRASLLAEVLRILYLLKLAGRAGLLV